MNNTIIKKLQADLTQLLTDVNTFDEKQTKTLSRKIRMQLGDLKLEITGIRKELVDLDKAGY